MLDSLHERNQFRLTRTALCGIDAVMQRRFTDAEEAELLVWYRCDNVTHAKMARIRGVNQSTVTRAIARAAEEERKAKRRARKEKAE